MHSSSARVASSARKPTTCTANPTPSSASSAATSHGGGGAHVSIPSEINTIDRSEASGESMSAAARSEFPIGVYPRASRPAISARRRSLSTAPTGARVRMSSHPGAWFSGASPTCVP